MLATTLRNKTIKCDDDVEGIFGYVFINSSNYPPRTPPLAYRDSEELTSSHLICLFHNLVKGRWAVV